MSTLTKNLAELRAGGGLPRCRPDNDVSTDQVKEDVSTDSLKRLECPYLTMADSYKAGHFKMYPPADCMVAYGEFRCAFQLPGGEKMKDQRIVVYGLRYYIEQIVNRLLTQEGLQNALKFYADHCAGDPNCEYPFPKDLATEFIKTGHFPVKIEALPDGSVVYPHTPVFIITAEAPYSHLCTFLETILTMVWYPSCVATLSRHARTLIDEAFEESVPENKKWLADSRLHDFGFRGCTCVEQSVIGGSAHLLNFGGSDTMSACYYVKTQLNNNITVGTSIPATEHSVMTSWRKETHALLNLIVEHPGKFIACVMDSYDYTNALDNILPTVKDAVLAHDCTLILRPDSGDPVKMVLAALKAAEKAKFPMSTVEINKRFFKVFENVAVIQGDGIDITVMKDILKAVMADGYSAANVAFGMGGGLLQKVNRDTMSFATKLCYIKYARSEYPQKLKNIHSAIAAACKTFLREAEEAGKKIGDEKANLERIQATDPNDIRIESLTKQINKYESLINRKRFFESDKVTATLAELSSDVAGLSPNAAQLQPVDSSDERLDDKESATVAGPSPDAAQLENADSSDERLIMKAPSTDSGKFSLPGKLCVLRQYKWSSKNGKQYIGPHKVYPLELKEQLIGTSLDGKAPTDGIRYEDSMDVVYDCGGNLPRNVKWQTFQEVRDRIKSQWNSLDPVGDGRSEVIKAEQIRVASQIKKDLKNSHLNQKLTQPVVQESAEPVVEDTARLAIRTATQALDISKQIHEESQNIGRELQDLENLLVDANHLYRSSRNLLPDNDPKNTSVNPDTNASGSAQNRRQPNLNQESRLGLRPGSGIGMRQALNKSKKREDN